MKRWIVICVLGVFCESSSQWRPVPGELRYDEVCYLTSHNSYATTSYGYHYAQQNLPIPQQLSYGVRGLKLDTYIVDGEVFLCHKGPRLTRLLCGGKAPQPFKEVLADIKQFLDSNPTEVITIFFETYVKRSDQEIDEPFRKSGLDRYILRPCDWNAADGIWPTHDWMRKHSKRLIIFYTKGSTELCFNEWQHLAENQWGVLHPGKACNERPESKAYRTFKRSLYLLNFFPMFKLNFDKGYHQINTTKLTTFLAQVLERGLSTGSNKHLLPTFLSTDYIDIGDSLKQVIAINERKQRERLSTIV